MSLPSTAALQESAEASTLSSKELLEGLAQWFQTKGQCDSPLELVRQVVRPYSSLYMFQWKSPSQCPDLIVKVPVGPALVAANRRNEDHAESIRPRLYPPVDPSTTYWKEHAALQRIQHSLRLDDPKLAAVQVFGMIASHQGLVMQWLRQPSLRKTLYAEHRFRLSGRSPDLEKVLNHTGHWLSHHHRLPPLEYCETRNAHRRDFELSIRRFTDFLKIQPGLSKTMDALLDSILQAANEHLPPELPLGQLHGDFAPRNVFFDADLRVSVIDTMARFEGPVYEDLAKMIISIHLSGPQVLSGGWLYDSARLAQLERAFLQGYFQSGACSLPAVRLFMIQLLLEQWSALICRQKDMYGAKAWWKRARSGILQSGIRRMISKLMAVMDHTQESAGVLS